VREAAARWLVNLVAFEVLLIAFAGTAALVEVLGNGASAGEEVADPLGGALWLNLFILPTLVVYLAVLPFVLKRARASDRIVALAMTPLGFPMAYVFGVAGLFDETELIAYLLLPLIYGLIVRLPTDRSPALAAPGSSQSRAPSS
jgi:hypothetical protein